MLVFSFHGWRSGLNARGARPTLIEPAVGLQDLITGKINTIGMPLEHTGDYVTTLQNNGQNIIRTMNSNFDLRTGPVDLGKIIIDFKNDNALTLPNVGKFFYDFVNEVQSPCDGICLDLELNPLDQITYPKTAKDQELCYYWYTSLYPENNLINLR